MKDCLAYEGQNQRPFPSEGATVHHVSLKCPYLGCRFGSPLPTIAIPKRWWISSTDECNPTMLCQGTLKLGLSLLCSDEIEGVVYINSNNNSKLVTAISCAQIYMLLWWKNTWTCFCCCLYYSEERILLPRGTHHSDLSF